MNVGKSYTVGKGSASFINEATARPSPLVHVYTPITASASASFLNFFFFLSHLNLLWREL